MLFFVMMPKVYGIKKNKLTKDRYCLIPLIGGPWRSQIYRDRKQMVGARCGAGDGESVSWAQSFQFGKMRKFSRWMVGMVAQ